MPTFGKETRTEIGSPRQKHFRNDALEAMRAHSYGEIPTVHHTR